jgi:hypothetical protein
MQFLRERLNDVEARIDPEAVNKEEFAELNMDKGPADPATLGKQILQARL